MLYTHELKDLYEGISKIARKAGEIPREHYQRASTTTIANNLKGQIDLVTEADRETEKMIVEILKRAYPQYGIIGEEGGSYTPDPAPTHFWFVDPIDGTTNFVHHIPQFAVSIALVDADHNPVLGVVYDPLRDELFGAYQGGGAFLNDKPLRISQTSRLNESVVATGFPYDRFTNPENNVAEFSRMILKVQGMRRMGSAALDLAYVAAGRFDGYWEKINPWDGFAGMIMVTEAGGQVTDYDGGSERLRGEKIYVVASNGRIHQAMVETLSPAAEPEPEQAEIEPEQAEPEIEPNPTEDDKFATTETEPPISEEN